MRIECDNWTAGRVAYSQFGTLDFSGLAWDAASDVRGRTVAPHLNTLCCALFDRMWALNQYLESSSYLYYAGGQPYCPLVAEDFQPSVMWPSNVAYGGWGVSWPYDLTYACEWPLMGPAEMASWHNPAGGFPSNHGFPLAPAGAQPYPQGLLEASRLAWHPYWLTPIDDNADYGGWNHDTDDFITTSPADYITVFGRINAWIDALEPFFPLGSRPARDTGILPCAEWAVQQKSVIEQFKLPTDNSISFIYIWATRADYVGGPGYYPDGQVFWDRDWEWFQSAYGGEYPAPKTVLFSLGPDAELVPSTETLPSQFAHYPESGLWDWSLATFQAAYNAENGDDYDIVRIWRDRGCPRDEVMSQIASWVRSEGKVLQIVQCPYGTGDGWQMRCWLYWFRAFMSYHLSSWIAAA